MAEYREMRGEPEGATPRQRGRRIRSRSTRCSRREAPRRPSPRSRSSRGGDGFIHGARAAAARAVFRDGVAAGAYEDPVAKFGEAHAAATGGADAGGADAGVPRLPPPRPPPPLPPPPPRRFA